MSMLPYISDQDFLREVRHILDVAQSAMDASDEQIYANVIDPFSAVVDAMRQDVSISDWLRLERARQIQKTMQNELGNFHQRVLGSVDGWEDLGTGSVLDLVNNDKKIIAEVKNKHNTTKGNHKREIYEDLSSRINSSHKGYVGYYVEIIRKAKHPFDKPFTPPDNRTNKHMPTNKSIRKIDGRSFYALATGIPNAIDLLYEALPHAISKILNIPNDGVIEDPSYIDLFQRAYPETRK